MPDTEKNIQESSASTSSPNSTLPSPADISMKSSDSITSISSQNSVGNVTTIETPTTNSVVQQIVKVNVPTGNSFEGLTEEELNFSVSTTIGANRSCPETNLHMSTPLKEIKKKFKKLQEKYNIMDDLTTKLLMENEALKKKLDQYESKIDVLTKICKSPHSNRKMHSITKNITNAPKYPLPPIIKIVSQNMESPMLFATPLTEMMSEDTLDSINSSSEITKKQNIFIIGDESLRGLSATILETRNGQWNDNFLPSAFIMPDAPSTHIVSSIDFLTDSMTDNDIVVLGIGKHDRNIQELHSNLCIALNKLGNVPVLLCPVNCSSYLNESKLNSEIKIWT
ncbi:hypothetical protein O0L34_g17875 [Tuta absoluta]|nr:hypothetical protein O0L34_g17875 [Tuta absoluta]